jgi:hypothetical protein
MAVAEGVKTINTGRTITHQGLRITVCNNRCWPNPVIFIAVAWTESGFALMNAAIQWFMAKKLIFKCGEFLEGDYLDVWRLRNFLCNLQKPEKHINGIKFLLMRQKC